MRRITSLLPPILLLLLLSGLFSYTKAQFTPITVTPADSACAGDTLTIHFPNLNLLPGDIVTVRYNNSPLSLTNLDALNDLVQVVTNLNTPLDSISRDLLVRHRRPPLSNTSIGFATYKVRAVPEVVYPFTYYCQQAGGLAVPVITGGPVSFSPLSIGNLDLQTGALDLTPPIIGPQVIEWSQPGCPQATAKDTLTIDQPSPIQLNYFKTTVCKGSDVVVPLTSPTNWQGTGIFSITAINGPANGLVLDSLMSIDVLASDTGVYQIKFAPNDACSPPDSVEISIFETLSAEFSYPKDTFCIEESNPLPLAIHPGGIYTGGISFATVPAGVVVPATGELDLHATYQFDNGYWVTYSLGGDCPSNSAIEIRLVDISSQFSLASQACKANGGFVSAFGVNGRGQFHIEGITNGVNYTIDNPNGNAIMDVIWLDTISVGDYRVIFELDSLVNPCYSRDTALITINGVDGSPFYFPDTALCQLDQSYFPDTTTTPVPGFFTSTPGLNIDSLSGEINPSSSSPGNYLVYYQTNNGGCATGSFVDLITINAPDSVSLVYDEIYGCKDATDTLVALLSPLNWQSVGNFSIAGINVAASGLILNPNGSVNLNHSLPGEYKIKLTPSGNCAVPDSVNFLVEAPLSPSFAYLDSVYCLIESDPIPTALHLGGRFKGGLSFLPDPDVVIDSLSGEIDLVSTFNNLFPSNSFSVTYSLGGLCPSDTNVAISLSDKNAIFQLPNQVCKSTGGFVEATAINGKGTFYIQDLNNAVNYTVYNSTGATNLDILNLDTLPIGSYEVIHVLDTSFSPCYHSFRDTIEVLGVLAPNYSYPTTAWCQLESPFLPVQTNTNWTGTFHADSDLDLQLNGEIDPGGSRADTYPVYFLTFNNGCWDNLLVDSITIVPKVATVVDYGGDIFCAYGDSAAPVQVYPPNGIFSGSPGLIIDSSTGTIDLSNMAVPVGDISYSLTYTPHPDSCSPDTTLNIIIRNISVTFNYDSTEVCDREAPLDVMNFSSSLNANVPGVHYGFTTPGLGNLTLTSSSGDITPNPTSVSAPTTFQVFYYVPDPICPDSFPADDSLTIYPSPSAGFLYDISHCKNGGDLVPDTVRVGGGLFSAIPNNPLNSISINSSGVIDIDQTDPGTYTVFYDLTGAGCPVDSQMVVTIKDSLVSTFSYGRDSFCINSGQLNPITQQGVPLGTFSVISPNHDSIAIDYLGEIITDSDSTDPGFYTIEHLAAHECAIPFETNITLLAGDNPDFEYDKFNYCKTENIATVKPDSILNNSGFYSSLDVGLSLNDTSGIIYVSLSDTGNYTIYFTPTVGVFCPDRYRADIRIQYKDDTTQFDYGQAAYCQGAPVIKPIILGDTSGNFTSGPEIDWNLPDSGWIDIGEMDTGRYIVGYELNGVCNEEFFDTLTVLPFDDVWFEYVLDSVCSNQDDITPSRTNLAGYFSWDSTILKLNPANGTIDVDASSPTLHTITYSSDTGCFHSSTKVIRIIDAPANLELGEDYFIEYDNPLLQDNEFSLCENDSVNVRVKAANLVYDLFINQDSIDEFSTTGYQHKFLPPTQSDSVSLKIQQRSDAICSESESHTLYLKKIPILTLFDDGYPQDSHLLKKVLAGKQFGLYMESDVENTHVDYTTVSMRGLTHEDSLYGRLGWQNGFGVDSLRHSFKLTSDYVSGSAILELTPVANGCTGDPIHTQFLVNPQEAEIFIPEVFTPNGDGINDTWHIQWTDEVNISAYSLRLYNRSMGEVLHMQPLRSDWRAEGLPAGIYWWILEGPAPQTGGLSIRR